MTKKYLVTHLTLINDITFGSIVNFLYNGYEEFNKTFFNMTERKIILRVEGETNDLLQVSNKNNMKRTSLVYFNENSKEVGEEVITVSIDSTNEALTFPIFDRLLNKKIRVTVETVDDEQDDNELDKKFRKMNVFKINEGYNEIV